MMKSLLCFILLMFTYSLHASELVVFYPSSHSVKEIEQTFEKGLAKEQVTVLAKFRDFKQILRKNKPDYLIVGDSFSHLEKDYKKELTLLRNNSKQEKFILLSLKKSFSKKNFSKARLGMVTTLPKKIQRKYAKEVFSQKFKQIKTVSKPEDLFPLLVFEAVDMIAIEPHIYKDLKKKYSTKVYQVGVSKPISTPALFIKKGIKKKSIIRKIKNMKSLGKIGFSGAANE